MTFLYAVSSQAVDLYVHNTHPSCSNTATAGSASHPFCSMVYGLGRLASGDRLWVRAGTYNESPGIRGPAGTASAPTIIQAYPGETVVLRGPGVDGGRTRIAETQYITFDGFEITNYNQGLFIDGSHHITVQNCRIHHVGQEALHVRNNSSDITIQNNIIHDTRQWQFNGEGMYIGTGSAGPLDNTHRVFIRNNTVYNTTDEGIELKPGTHDCIVEGNLVYNSATRFTTPAVGAIEINESILGVQSWTANPNHIVRNNTIHTSHTAIRAGTGCSVYNNVIYNISSPYNGIHINNANNDSHLRRIYHNTVHLPAAIAIVTAAGSTDIRNNIGPSTSGNIATNASLFVNASGQDFRLVGSAAAVNSGVDLTSVLPAVPALNRDRLDVTRPQGSGWDLGAYEYASGAPPPVSACDVNRDNATTVADIQLCVNQSLNVVPCTTGDINDDGVCTVIDVQRVVNAALGGACLTR